MDFSALGGCHQQIHQVPRRSSVSSEHSSKLRFSRLFSFIPAGASLFCLGMLALLLTLPCVYLVGAVTFAFNGYNESDVYMVPGSSWTFQANTSCFYFDPPEASWSKSVPGRFLYPNLVQMKDPVTKQVKSFSTTFIYQIQIQRVNSFAIGPGMAFIAVPDNVTVGAALDYMGLLTTNTSTTAKNYESDNHTLGVELDTCRNLEFNDPNENHIGVNLASMISTFTVTASHTLASVRQDFYQQIWIDYFEADSRMDISIAHYGEGKPDRPQGSQTGLDLSLLREKMYIGFSTAKGIESLFLSYVCAWSFSNDGIPAPPIVMGLNATSASPPAPPSASPESLPWPSPSLVPAQNTTLFSECPKPLRRIVPLVLYVQILLPLLLLSGTMLVFVFYACRCRRPLYIFISHTGGVDGSGKNFPMWLHREMTCIDTEKSRKRANQRAVKEIGVMIYINKLLRLLFAFSGQLIILSSVILDNSFNGKPVRFTAFAILALVMTFLGFLASGWFPRIPLRFIAFVKQCGFLQHVVSCSPWHDNVVTDYFGEVCTLEPMEQDEGTRLFELPNAVQNFLSRDRFPPQGTTQTTYSHSALDSDIQDCQAVTSPLEIQGQDVQEVSTLNPQSQDFETSSVQFQVFLSEVLDRPHVVVLTDQESLPILQEAPSRVGDIVGETGHSLVFHVLGDEREPILEFDGPEINGFPLKVQAIHNTSTKDRTFDLSCTFRNKKTRRMYLTTERLHNLVLNMRQWVKTPYPIVVDESSDILHCLAIQDILWELTKTVYTFKSVRVEHRFLAGLEKSESAITALFFALVTFILGLIPLILDKRSNWFLLLTIFPVSYLLTSLDNSYYFRSLLCPIFMKYKGFRKLYKSKSPCIWCNEFRKERIVNPPSFLIDQECANKLLDADSCFDTGDFLNLHGSTLREESFNMSCQGWPADDPIKEPEKQHDYELTVYFDPFKPGDTCYTNVKLSFCENGDPLGTRIYSSIEIQRLQLVEKLFDCYSNPSFGGYVDSICPCYWSQSYLGNCLRFLDICNKIITDSTMPTPLVAATKYDSRFIIGVPF